uniref:Huntingtin n=1 Tax=Timema shepardi TaxID=629360 RepID=A0A7R9B2K7_TIMSH|nr:unnamed protein product [Timema shepardi]
MSYLYCYYLRPTTTRQYDLLCGLCDPIERHFDITGKKSYDLNYPVAYQKKEKVALCVSIADVMCSSGVKGTPNFSHLLSITMEMFLQLCNDPHSDVRMIADESLNRIIRAMLDNNVVKIQVELHKEIKKNGSARTLRAALWRFAELCHMIRPQKGKPYVLNLIPCILHIAQRTEEPVLETLAVAMPKIFAALGNFTSDNDVKSLLKVFLVNLSSPAAVVRRTAATSILAVCVHCRKPHVFIAYILNTLLDCVVPIRDTQPVWTVLGVLGCLRHLLPHFGTTKPGEEELKGSFGVRKRHQEAPQAVDRLIQLANALVVLSSTAEDGEIEVRISVYELCLHYTNHPDHNVVNAALETLHQLLQAPPGALVPVLLSPQGITRSRVHATDGGDQLSRRSLSQMSVAPSLAPGDIGSLLDPETDPDLTSVERWVNESKPGVIFSSSLSLLPPAVPERVRAGPSEGPEDEDEEESCVSQVDEGPQYSNIRIGQIREQEESVLDSPSRPPLSSVQSFQQSEDTKLSPDDEQTTYSVPLSPTFTQTSVPFSACDVGSFTDADVSLKFCSRHLAAMFLLTGCPGHTMPDRNIRVSVKALALSCLASILRLTPDVFLLPLDKNKTPNTEGVQLLSDTLLYSQHSDPQLRALVSTLISSVLKSALIQSGRDLSRWLGDTSLVLPGHFLELLLKGLKDESSVCCGQTLAAVGACLPDLLECVDNRQWLPILGALLDMVANPYWLVKVKLAGVVGEMSFVTIHHLVGSPDYQEKILHSVLLVLLRDENARVRHAAAEAFVKTVPYLFYPVDHGGQDPVTAKAALYSRVYISPLIVGCLQGHPSSLPQRPNISSLPAPFNVGLTGTYVASLDAALSRVVNLLSQQLLMSQSRHLVFGCCETLTLLSVEYLTTVYPQAWNCQLAPRKNSQSAGVPVSASAGLLATTLSLLTSSPVSVDLSCQQWLLHLAGNMFSGLAVNSLRTVEILSPPSQVDPHKELWAMFQDRQLSVLSEHLLGHVLRLLSIFVHVLEDAHPTLPSTKIPVPPSLSPIKRKGRMDITESRGMSPVKIGLDKEDKMEEKKSGRGVPLGLFANLPHYVKIHDMVKSAYTNYKTIHPRHIGSNARQSTLVTLGPMPDNLPSSRCVQCQTILPRHIGSNARQSTLVTLGPIPDNTPSSRWVQYQTIHPRHVGSNTRQYTLVTLGPIPDNTPSSRWVQYQTIHPRHVGSNTRQYTLVTLGPIPDNTPSSRWVQYQTIHPRHVGSNTRQYTLVTLGPIPDNTPSSRWVQYQTIHPRHVGSNTRQYTLVTLGPIPDNTPLSHWVQCQTIYPRHVVSNARQSTLVTLCPMPDNPPSSRWVQCQTIHPRHIVSNARQYTLVTLGSMPDNLPLSHWVQCQTIYPRHVVSNAKQSTLVTLCPMPDNPPSSRWVQCQTIHPRHVVSNARQSNLVTLCSMPDNPPSSRCVQCQTILPRHVGFNTRQSTLVTLGSIPDNPPSSRWVQSQTIHPRHVGSNARQYTLVTLGPIPDNTPSSRWVQCQTIYPRHITLDCGASEKFISLLRTTLEALSQLLEIVSLHEAGRVAEEILAYMRLTISIEPTSTVKCVQQTRSATYGSCAVCPQLLKSLFGTNLSARWEEEPDKRPQMGLNSGGGFYNTCLQIPYKHLTDYVSSASSTLDHIAPWLNYFYKKGERKASTVFKSVNRGADKTALASYIRLFEPMVIKALKQYTVTSDVQLQCRVLLLLIQLVQLRVNYCLLDSDQIFIGFVLKQFEFIEEGQIPRTNTCVHMCTRVSQCRQLARSKSHEDKHVCAHMYPSISVSPTCTLRVPRGQTRVCTYVPEYLSVANLHEDSQQRKVRETRLYNMCCSQPEELVPRIFYFLVHLSYEKHHSKCIIGVPKVIQLCDELMASGQPPVSHCIQALVPVVEDVFLVRGTTGSTADLKDLDTQREFLVSMLLRLVEYHQVLELLGLVLSESRQGCDWEERWRRWSRQVMDTLLPLLAKGRVRLESRVAQLALHRLLAAASPCVLRPVDPLLKVLLSDPLHLHSSLVGVQRWLGMVLAVLSVLVAQGKEEVVLARLEELGLSVPSPEIIYQKESRDPLNATQSSARLPPDQVLARMLLRVLGVVSSELHTCVLNPVSSEDWNYLHEQFSVFLLYCIHMFQSGASMQQHPGTGVTQVTSRDWVDTGDTGSYCRVANATMLMIQSEGPESLPMADVNTLFLELSTRCPLLTFLWCYLLTLLNYSDQGFWAQVLRTQPHQLLLDQRYSTVHCQGILVQACQTRGPIGDLMMSQ